MDILIRIAQLMLSLTILVFIHELGHFLFAKSFGMRVSKFYLFFDPWFALFRHKPKKSETEYGIGWLPLGGYCAIDGMVDERLAVEGMASEPEPWEFRAKPAWQRFLVMVAGVLFNVILAMLIYGGIAYTWGTDHIPMRNVGTSLTYTSVGHSMGLQDGDLPIAIDGKPFEYYEGMMIQKIADGKVLTVLRDGKEMDVLVPVDLIQATLVTDSAFMYLSLPAVVDQIVPGSNAERDGLRKGDRVVALNGVKVEGLHTLLPDIQSGRGDSIRLTVLRDGREVVIPTLADVEDGLGVAFGSPADVLGIEHRSYSIVESIPAGVSEAYKQLVGYTGQLKYVATKEGATKLGGFGTLGSLFAPVWNWRAFWSMTAFISVILAVMNLLPIPGLDGGHILFIFIEILRGKPVSLKWQTRLQIFGMILLLGLVLYANVLDIFRFLL